MNEPTLLHRMHWSEWLAFIGILVLLSLLMLRRLFDTSLGYPDADRILMDGVFFHDFLREWPLLRIYEYTIQYFGQYPALSIGYRPPFFPVIEGVFNSVFGVNMWSSRLALLTFALAGVSAYYFLVRRMFGSAAAAGAGLLLVTTPFFVKFGWYTMGEVPVLSMALITAWCYYRYLESDSNRYLALTVISVVLAIWTKQTAGFLLLWMLFHQLTTGRFRQLLTHGSGWIAVGAIIVGLLPLAAITLWLGEQNLDQSVGTGEGAALSSRLQLDVFLVHIHQLYRFHLTPGALTLSLIGILWALFRRDRRVWFWLSFIITVYLFFTYIKGPSERYPIFWIPAFLAFAGALLAYAGERSRQGFWLGVVAIGLVVVGQVWQVYRMEPRFATGYDAAARFVVERSNSPTVFFDGYNNGYFVYFMRAFDPARSFYVLRGDKLLSSTSIAGTNKLKVHAHNANDIDAILDQFGPQYIVVEDRNTIGIPIHATLRDHLRQSARFRLVKTIPVDTGHPSTREDLDNLNLLIYERLDRTAPRDGVLELRLPVVGKTLRIPMRDLRPRVQVP
jgi:hypothetical protein